MEESIYNIVEEEAVPVQRPPRYRSVHPGTGQPTGTTFTSAGTAKPGVGNLGGNVHHVDEGPHKYAQPHATMGRPLQPYNPNATKNFMKSQKQFVPTLKTVQATHPQLLKPSKLKEKKKPKLPGKEEKPIMGLCTSKNFIVSNAVETILAAPKKSVNNDIDFLAKEDYGQAPPYLGKIRDDINAEYEYIRDLQEQQALAAQQTRPLAQDEKESLIGGLKAKWEQVNSEYQLTTHLTKFDTIGKIARKKGHEAELNSIEKKIDQLKRDNIHVDVTC